VVNGHQKAVANTGLSSLSDGSVVGVRMQGDIIDVTLEGQVVRTVTDKTLAGATRVGLTARGPEPQGATFDDFTVSGP
jgi:hypothetical protein